MKNILVGFINEVAEMLEWAVAVFIAWPFMAAVIAIVIKSRAIALAVLTVGCIVVIAILLKKLFGYKV